MIISHTHKFIFVKSEKTGGTSVEAALSNICHGRDIVTPLGDYPFNRDEDGEWVHKSLNPDGFKQHDDAITIKSQLPADVWDSYYKFSITRNPWDKVVSDFFWQYRQHDFDQPIRRFYHFIGYPYDELKPIRKMFKNFVKGGQWKTNDRFYIINDELCVDYIIRYEHLTEGLREVCKRVGLPELRLPHLKSGMRKRGHHYSVYYDEETRAIVSERHQHDIRLFGYIFETA